MILILGSTRDDILYFESVMVNKKEELIFDRYKATIGTIFNQEVIVVHDLYTSYVSALVTSYIIQKYYVILVFVVGKCISYSNDMENGDIAVSKRVILGDVNQVKEADVRLGQVPHFPRSLETDEEIISYVSSALEKRSFSHFFNCTFISSNAVFNSTERVKDIEMDGSVLGHRNNVVFDCTSGGAFLASAMSKIPSISIKVVESHMDEKTTVEHYMNVLKQYSAVGKAIVTCIGDIGRNDIIRE